jgi:hypothetical protein
MKLDKLHSNTSAAKRKSRKGEPLRLSQDE